MTVPVALHLPYWVSHKLRAFTIPGLYGVIGITAYSTGHTQALIQVTNMLGLVDIIQYTQQP